MNFYTEVRKFFHVSIVKLLFTFVYFIIEFISGECVAYNLMDASFAIDSILTFDSESYSIFH